MTRYRTRLSQHKCNAWAYWVNKRRQNQQQQLQFTNQSLRVRVQVLCCIYERECASTEKRRKNRTLIIMAYNNRGRQKGNCILNISICIFVLANSYIIFILNSLHTVNNGSNNNKRRTILRVVHFVYRIGEHCLLNWRAFCWAVFVCLFVVIITNICFTAIYRYDIALLIALSSIALCPLELWFVYCTSVVLLGAVAWCLRCCCCCCCLLFL